MARRKLTLPQTSVVVTFEFATNNEAQLIHLLQLAVSLVMMLWRMFQAVYYTGSIVAGLISDLWQAAKFVTATYRIIFVSVRYGLGL